MSDPYSGCVQPTFGYVANAHGCRNFRNSRKFFCKFRDFSVIPPPPPCTSTIEATCGTTGGVEFTVFENFPEGPTIKKNNLARNFQYHSKISISTSRLAHKNRAAVGGSLEVFNLARHLDFFDLWALWVIFVVNMCYLTRYATTLNPKAGLGLQR